MRNVFGAERDPAGVSKRDVGSGSLKDYGYDLLPRKNNTVLVLAGSDPHQAELVALEHVSALQAFIAPRTAEEERTDAPIPVRFFAESRMTGIVGTVPRGLEPAVLEALVRLERAGRSTRIPAAIIKTRYGLRVELQLGATR